MNLKTLQKYYDNGLLIKQTHPTLPLTIWNYSKTTQYEQRWDEITLQCRGLVTDDKGNVVARPFKKFFNMEECKYIPTSDFEVFAKMDGSLIIMFFYEGNWVIASRGSFTSDYALKAVDILNDNINEILANPLNEEYTYLFEVIFPEGQIVVNYGDSERLVMLGAIKTSDGTEMPYDELIQYAYGFEIVKKYDGIEDYQTLKSLIKDNEEGFVVKFSNGDRMKIKGEEYIRLHRIMTDISTKRIWEVLSNGESMEDYLTNVPDEFYSKIKEYETELENKFWNIADIAYVLFNKLYVDGMQPVEFANAISKLNYPYKSLLFAQFHIKMQNYSQTIWNYLKPNYKKL